MATIIDFIKQWQKSLHIEADFLKAKGGTRHTITDGRCLSTTEDGATYWFMLVSDVFLPDGTQVRLEVNNQEYFGSVVSVEGFDVVIKLDTYIGEKINEAFLYSEPWELLIQLAKRFESVKENSVKQSRVAKLITAKAPAKHPNNDIENPVKELFLRAKYNATTYVWGPPGTGKTYTLARMIAARYINGQKILVLSHSNAAIDGLMLEVADFMKTKNLWSAGDIIRYGTSSDARMINHPDLLAAKLVAKNNPDLNAKLSQLEIERNDLRNSLYEMGGKRFSKVVSGIKNIRSQIKEKESEYVSDAQVVGTTLSKAAMDPLIYNEDFDLVVVDEASMAYIPQLAFAASLGKRVVICGDFKQLPPIAVSSDKLVERWLKRDIFEVSKVNESINGKPHHNLFMLTKQRRMHSDISSFTNQYIYENKVSDHPSVRVSRQLLANKQPFEKEAAVLVDLSSMGAYALKDSSSDSRYNLFSALVAMQLMLTAKADGIESIGFISPFRAQSRLVTTLIQDLLPDNMLAHGHEKIIAATVHKFQGSERDMIVFDSVDSYPQSRASMLLTDKKSEKLINVAVTRAKSKFIHIADRKYLESRTTKNHPVVKLINHLHEQNNSYSRNELLNFLPKNNHSGLTWFAGNYEEVLIQDILKAKKIVISASNLDKISNRIWLALKRQAHKASITLVTPNLDGIQLETFKHVPTDLVMPYIQINEDVLWVGTPIMETNFQSSPKPPFIQARVISRRAVQVFNSFLNLSAAKPTNKSASKVVSYRPSYTLTKYIQSWDQCPACRSIRKIETKADGKVHLRCDYCGNNYRMNKWILEKYLEYANHCCRTCNRIIEVSEEGNDLHVECSHCKEKIKIVDLL